MLYGIRVFIPHILNNLNKFRNDIEHTYTEPPEFNEVKEYISVVDMFLRYTSDFLTTPKIIEVDNHSFLFDLEEQEIKIIKNQIKQKTKIDSNRGWKDLAVLLIEDKVKERIVIEERLRALGYPPVEKRDETRIREDFENL